MLRTQTNEMMIYYDKDSSKAKKTLAFARTITPHIREVEYHRSPLTPSLLRDLLVRLELRPKDIMNKAHPFYQENVKGRDFDDESWLHIITKNPDIIRSPIAIKGDKAILVDNPTDIYRLGV